MAALLLSGAVAGSILLVPSVVAFASLPAGTSPHDEITRAAAQDAGYPEDGRAALLEAVRAPDLEEMEWKPTGDEPFAIGLQDDYRPEHHCDRLLPADHQTSFRNSATYIARQRQAAASEMAAGNASEAVRTLGRTLHAVQDCFSHTNAAEHGPTQLHRLEAALLDEGPMPQGLLLGALSPHIDAPGKPDDPYGHDHHAKDSPHYNTVAEDETATGHSHYDLAHDAAANASARVLADFLEPLDDDQRNQLAELSFTDTDRYMGVVNAPTIAVVVGLTAVVAALTLTGLRWWRTR